MSETSLFAELVKQKKMQERLLKLPILQREKGQRGAPNKVGTAGCV